MADNSNEKIYFSVDYVFSMISEILEKNGLKSTSLDDIEDNQDSSIDIVFNLAKDLAGQIISEKDFISSLQKQAKVSKKSAEGILKGIKEKLLPFAEKVKIGGNNTETANPAKSIKQTATAKPQQPEETEKFPKTVLPQERPKSNGPDKYREEIV